MTDRADPDQQRPTRSPLPPLGPMRIWLVEDSPMEAAMIRGALLGTGEVEIFHEGTAMLERLSVSPPDVLVLDWRLPELSGLEICQFVRSRLNRASLPIVMLTALTEKEDLAEALRAGANDYVGKPFAAVELIARVENAYLTKTLFDRARRAEQALQQQHGQLAESEAKFRRLAESGLVGIVEATLDGQVLEANPTFLGLVGQTLEDVAAGRTHLGLLTPKGWEAADARARAEIERDGLFTTYEKALQRPDGVPVHVLMGGALLPNVPGRMVAYVLDVSARRAAADDRERIYAAENRARLEAERVSRLKDEFLATVSHELRTPLNAIVGWSDLLRTDTTGKVDQARALEIISRNARAQSKMIEDILDVSRIIGDTFKIERRAVDLSTVAAAAVDAVSPTARKKQITVTLHAEDAAMPLSADPERLSQVVTNLLANAVKFTPTGGSVDVTLGLRDAAAWVAVRDSGQGMSAELLPAVFDRFRQADSSSTRRHAGLGLGLSIARHLVDLHGGTISAQSAGEGQGSTFTVELPLAVPDSAAAAASEAPRITPVVGEASPLEGLHTLIVDDTEDSLAVLSAILVSLGCRVRLAGSAREAIAALDEELPDVLLSDLAMPDEDGFALVRAVRSREPAKGGQLPAVAVSAYAGEQDAARSRAAGFQAHVPKPVSAARLVQALAHLPRRAVRA